MFSPQTARNADSPKEFGIKELLLSLKFPICFHKTFVNMDPGAIISATIDLAWWNVNQIMRRFDNNGQQTFSIHNLDISVTESGIYECPCI